MSSSLHNKEVHYNKILIKKSSLHNKERKLMIKATKEIKIETRNKIIIKSHKP